MLKEMNKWNTNEPVSLIMILEPHAKGKLKDDGSVQ